ncbi:hypothetical protein KSS87_022801, partial [Heliosperma pusillum]
MCINTYSLHYHSPHFYTPMDLSIYFGFLITLLVFSAGQAAPSDGKLYWKSKLPNTLMPQAVLDA